ncbi:amidohydrolase [Sphingomonas astaxanthinifaciens]|uniref:Amidohydrolase n=1 Tax=Sphingomonas astaxanthinifaciens DSM 22298 TaxID=1123267 RepID=A0ABQ5Z5Q2_9SPHN|nr:amidohydrolase [Sphingomonas astaxanthinifaciens]GLR48085.1 putative amidohydrolase [Sphingomonas astaxanthinifaciens DSM 22298]
MLTSLLAAAAAAAAPVPPADASLMALYRELHAAPELSMQEVKTAARLAPELKKLGFTVTEKVGGTGIVGVLRNGPGKTLLMRADMDGLPVVEQTGLPFASKVRATARSGVETGVMHACGHDTHMTAMIGAVRRLVADKANWSGTLLVVFQPGEETGEGAKAMLDAGLYNRFPKPDTAIAFHDSASLPAGTIGITPGYALANVDSVDILVKGVGGHGAYPQTTKDPIVLASQIVMALQTLVSRENSPLDPAVVTVGSFQAGAKHNIIPDEAKLQLTVRSYTPAVRKLLLDGIARIARGEAIAAGLPADRMPVVTVREELFTPSTFNTEAISNRTLALFEQRFGADRVKKVPPVMGGEDFSRFWLADQKIDSLIFWVGGVPQAAWDKAGGDPAKLPSLHSPFWAPEAETVIATASEALATAAMAELKKR